MTKSTCEFEVFPVTRLCSTWTNIVWLRQYYLLVSPSAICLRLLYSDQDVLPKLGFLSRFLLVDKFVDLLFSHVFYIFLLHILYLATRHSSFEIVLVFSGFGFHKIWRLAWWTFLFSLDANHSVLFRAARKWLV